MVEVTQDYCNPEWHYIDAYRVVKAQAQKDMSHAAIAKAVAAYVANECAAALTTAQAQAAAQEQRIAGLEAMLMEAIERVEAGDLEQRMCCDGHMCGCQGSTYADQFLHFARAALGEQQ